MNHRIVAALAIMMCASCADAMPPMHDGTWWATLSQDQRLSYLAGVWDCATFDGGKLEIRNVSWYSIEPVVTRHYKEQPGQVEIPVTRVFFLAAKVAARSDPTGGEPAAGKHGIFDGDYWRQMLPAERTAFVQGYLDCWVDEGLGPIDEVQPEWLEKTISDWYGVSLDDPAEIREDRQDAKIADVLARVRKGRHGASSVHE